MAAYNMYQNGLCYSYHIIDSPISVLTTRQIEYNTISKRFREVMSLLDSKPRKINVNMLFRTSLGY